MEGADGETVVVLDEKGQELGRAVGRATGCILAVFDPPLTLPPKGERYELHRVPAR